jgi:hypothetical protein
VLLVKAGIAAVTVEMSGPAERDGTPVQPDNSMPPEGCSTFFAKRAI